MFFACLLKHVHKFVSPDSEGMIQKIYWPDLIPVLSLFNRKMEIDDEWR